MDNVAANNLDTFFKLLNFEKVFILTISLISLSFVVKLTKFVAEFLGESFPTKRILISQVQTVFAYFLYVIGGTYLIFSIIAPTKEIILSLIHI